GAAAGSSSCRSATVQMMVVCVLPCERATQLARPVGRYEGYSFRARAAPRCRRWSLGRHSNGGPRGPYWPHARVLAWRPGVVGCPPAVVAVWREWRLRRLPLSVASAVGQGAVE